jgi:hypothetical protein
MLKNIIFNEIIIIVSVYLQQMHSVLLHTFIHFSLNIVLGVVSCCVSISWPKKLWLSTHVRSFTIVKNRKCG